MNISDITYPLNAESLSEIVASQISGFGNQALQIRPETNFIDGNTIFIENNVLIFLMADDEMINNGVTLESILETLNSAKLGDSINYIPISKSEFFTVGFHCEDEGFIEVFTSDQIKQNEGFIQVA